MADPAADTVGLLDTSVLVRYLTGDPPAVAMRARDIIEDDGIVLVSDVVLLETAHVLRAVYSVPREALLDALISFIRRANVRTSDRPKEILVTALELCRPSGRVSIGDALIWAAARASGVPVHTFDQRFPSEGVEVRTL